jgi:hypothetical protein
MWRPVIAPSFRKISAQASNDSGHAARLLEHEIVGANAVRRIADQGVERHGNLEEDVAPSLLGRLQGLP